MSTPREVTNQVCYRSSKLLTISSLRVRRRLLKIAVVVVVTVVISSILMEAVYISRPKPTVPNVVGAGTGLESEYVPWISLYQSNSGKVAAIKYEGSTAADGFNLLNVGNSTFSGIDFSSVTPYGGDDKDYAVFPSIRDAIQIATSPQLAPNCSVVNMSLVTLTRIYTGVIIDWSDPEIWAVNPCLRAFSVQGQIWPLHRTDPSATTFALTRMLAKYDPVFQVRGNYSWPLNPTNPNNLVLENNDQIVYATSLFPLALGYFFSSFMGYGANVNPVSIINEGGFSVPLNATTMYEGAQEIAAQIENNPTATVFNYTVMGNASYPLITTSYLAFKQQVQVAAKDVRNPGVPNSCLNIQAALQFLVWIMQDEPSRYTADHAFVMPLPRDLERLQSLMPGMRCNGYNVATYNFDDARIWAIVRNLILTGLASCIVCISLGVIIILLGERQYKNDLERLAKLIEDEDPSFPASDLNESLLSTTYNDTLEVPLMPMSTMDDDGNPTTTELAAEGKNPSAVSSGSNATPHVSSSASSSASRSKSAAKSIQKLVGCMIDAGDLTLGKIVGSGSFGEVFAGLYDSHTVAIKRIAMSLDASLIQSFVQEISAMETLRHENVVRLLAISIADPYTYIVTEFCKNGSIQDVLDKKPEKLTLQVKLDLMRGAAQGMEYIHSRNFAHRDLKLSNILISTNWTAKICDLGTATTGSQVLRSRVGTPDYCAPEILDGQPYTNACDVYSFAICLWSFFSGQPLFPGMALYDMISKIVNGLRPNIDAITSPRLRALITHCWNKDPSRRPSFSLISEALHNLDVSDFAAPALPE